MQGRLTAPLDLRRIGDPEATRRHVELLAHFGEPSEVIAQQGQGRVHETPEIRARFEKECRWLLEAQAFYWLPDAYPGVQRLGRYAPRLLFLRGKFEPSLPVVAIVGTRHPDEYGTEVARRLAFALARAGVTIVSGGAKGIDQIAHEAALDAAGRTVVVFGSGLARPHPASLASLFERAVRESSALISEYPVFATPRRRHFPERNRLIAALADAVIVVQAGKESGALITAEWAKRLAVPLYAVPSDIWYHQSQGCLLLLRQGARPLVHPADLKAIPELAALSIRADDWPTLGHRPWGVANPWAAIGQNEGCSDVSEAGLRLMKCLTKGPADLDALVSETGLGASEVQAEMTMLELAGKVRRLPGGRWAIVNLDPKSAF